MTEGCDKEAYTKQYCKTHYQSYHYHKKNGTVRQKRAPFKAKCYNDTCDRPHYMKGCCRYHWDRLKSRCTVEQYNTIVGFESGVTKCSVDNCDRLADCKKMCSKHYAQVSNKGSVVDSKRRLYSRNNFSTPEELFMSKANANMSDRSQCWLWSGAFSGKFPVFFFNKTCYTAHRFSYMLHKQIDIEGQHIDWTCKNTYKCVNPAHLGLIEKIQRVPKSVLKRRDIKLAEALYRSCYEKEAIREHFGGEVYSSDELLQEYESDLYEAFTLAEEKAYKYD